MYMASTATLSLSGDLPQTITTPFWPTVIWQSVSFFSMLIIDPFRPIRRGILAALISTTRPVATFPSPGPLTVSRGSLVRSNASTSASTMSPTSQLVERSRLLGPLGPGVSEAGNIASYGARMSTDHPDNPMSTILPATRSPTLGKYPPFKGTTKTLFPSTSRMPTHAENICVPIRYALSPSRWSPSARTSPGATTCFGSATSTMIVFLLGQYLRLYGSLCQLTNLLDERAVHTRRHLYYSHQRSVRLPFLSAHVSEAFESVIGSGGVFRKDLYSDPHLLDLQGEDRSKLFYDHLRLLLGTLVGIDRETNLPHCLFNSERGMRSPSPRIDCVSGDDRDNLTSFILDELTALLCGELKLATLHNFFCDSRRVGRAEVFLKLLLRSPRSLA